MPRDVLSGLSVKALSSAWQVLQLIVPSPEKRGS
jgi:hypothetical protein